MKEWTIDTEEVQKYLERYPENRYLVESRGYNKDTFMEEIWIFVNEIIDKRLDEDVEMSISEISQISHLFRVDHYLICVYTSAKDEELSEASYKSSIALDILSRFGKITKRSLKCGFLVIDMTDMMLS